MTTGSNLEAVITVNGHALTSGQSMTVRVALEGFAFGLAENCLGNDAHGVAMTLAYRERVAEIRQFLYPLTGGQ